VVLTIVRRYYSVLSSTMNRRPVAFQMPLSAVYITMVALASQEAVSIKEMAPQKTLHEPTASPKSASQQKPISQQKPATLRNTSQQMPTLQRKPTTSKERPSKQQQASEHTSASPRPGLQPHQNEAPSQKQTRQLHHYAELRRASGLDMPFF